FVKLLFKDKTIVNEKLNRLKQNINEINKIYPIYDRFMPLSKKYNKVKKWEQGEEDSTDQINEIIDEFISNSISFVEQWRSYLKNEYPDLVSFYDEEIKLIY